MRKIRRFTVPTSVAARLASVPIIVVAVDLTPQGERLAEVLQRAVKRMLILEPDAGIASVNVTKIARIGINQGTDDQGNNLHALRLVQGQAIIDYATANKVDHIMMGARGRSTSRRYLGSVSAQVVAEAHCSVTVIRLPEGGTAETPPKAVQTVATPA